MNEVRAAFAALVTILAVSTSAQAACELDGHLHALDIADGGSAKLHLRASGAGSTLVYRFSAQDPYVLAAAMAAIPSRARVRVIADPTAVCSTGAGAAPIARTIFVTP